MNIGRVYVGAMLLCLLVSAGFYYLPRWRRLSTKTVKTMAKILHPANIVFLAIFGIALVGTLLLVVFDLVPEARLMFGVMAVAFVFVLPTWVGYLKADEVTKREQAESREKEELAGG